MIPTVSAVMIWALPFWPATPPAPCPTCTPKLLIPHRQKRGPRLPTPCVTPSGRSSLQRDTYRGALVKQHQQWHLPRSPVLPSGRESFLMPRLTRPPIGSRHATMRTRKREAQQILSI